MSSECLYVLSNPSIKGLKIGRTSNGASGVKARIKELRTTGVPESFFCEYAILVEDSAFLEKEIHSFLREYRTSSNREFFSVDPLVVKLLLEIRVKGKLTDITKEVRDDSPKTLSPTIPEQNCQGRGTLDLTPPSNPFDLFTVAQLLNRYNISKQTFYDRLKSLEMVKTCVDTAGRSLYSSGQVLVLDKVESFLRQGYRLRQIPELISAND
jgi:hypothetical protein